MMAEAESRSEDGNSDIPRLQLYTNASTWWFENRIDPSLFDVNLDTWYYGERTDPLHFPQLGTLAQRDGPLTAAQGVAAFVAQQVAAFLEAFAEVFRPVWVEVGYKPQLSDVLNCSRSFSGPQHPAEIEAIQTTLEQSAAAYEGIINFKIAFEMRATVRDENGLLSEVWLPQAGEVFYFAHYSDRFISNLPQSVAVTYVLTPSAQAGVAQWMVVLDCNYSSLLRQTNAEMLARVRSHWQRWLQTHPSGAGIHGEVRTEGYIITLAVPPPGTPPDNHDLAERNVPRVRTAVARWAERLDIPFEWAVTL